MSLACYKDYSINVTAGCNFTCGPEQNIVMAGNPNPSACALDRTTNLLYGLVGLGGTTLQRLNATTLTIEASSLVQAVSGPSDLMFHSVNSRLYAACGTLAPGNGRIHRINSSLMSSEASNSNNLTRSMMASDSENDRIYVQGQDTVTGRMQVHQLDPTTMVLNLIATGAIVGNSFGVDYIPSTSALFSAGVGLIASADQPNSVTLRRADTFAVFSTLPMGGQIFDIRYAPGVGTGDALLISYFDGANYQVTAITVAPVYTSTVAVPFLAPAVGANIQIDVVTTAGLVPQPVFIGANIWGLVSIDNATQITVTNFFEVPGALVPAGTVLTGWGLATTNIVPPAADAYFCVSWAYTLRKIVLVRLTNILVLDPATYIGSCAVVPSHTFWQAPYRCDTDARCKLVLANTQLGATDYWTVL